MTVLEKDEFYNFRNQNMCIFEQIIASFIQLSTHLAAELLKCQPRVVVFFLLFFFKCNK